MSNASRAGAKSANRIGTQNAQINTPEQQALAVQKLGKSIPELERDRNQMEMTLTSSILLFNQRVTKQIDQLEKSIMYEVTGL